MNLQNPIGEAAMLFPTIFLLAFFFLIFKSISSKGSQLPPGPYAWPVIGNIFLLGKKPHVSLTSLARIHGQLISLRLGGQLLVVASSPAAAMQILKTHDRALSGRYVPAAFSKIPKVDHSTIIFSRECNDAWKFLRGICQNELFSAKAVESQSKLRVMKAREMVDYLCGIEGEIVKLPEIVFATLTNSLSNLLVSRDLVDFECKGENGRVKGLITKIVEMGATPGLADLYPILDGLDVWSKQKAKDMHEKIKSVWEDIIEARRERQSAGVSTRDFLDVLIQNGSCNDKISFLLMELLTAGTETSCTTIEWTMAELIKNEEAMYNLREELVKAIDGDVMKDSYLPDLPYLQACIKETMRLHPPGPFIFTHCALETCKVMNYTIPKDCLVLVNLWAIGRDPLVWHDPLRFKPERFLDSNLDFKGIHFQLLPFSAGRRMCPGLPVAVKQIQLVIASLVHYFDWFLPDGMDIPGNLDMNEKFGTTLQMEKPLLLIPRIRKQSKD